MSLEVLENILNSEVYEFENEPESLTTFRKLFTSNEIIECIEINIEFFKDIPEENLKEVLIDFLELLIKYESDLTWEYFNDNFTRKILDRNDKYKKPTDQKKQDINAIKKYQEVIERIYKIRKISKAGIIKIIPEDVPDYIYETYKENQKLINELETNDYKIISKHSYEKNKKVNKNEIKAFLENTIKVYSLEKVSLLKKQLIDSLPSRENY